MTRRADPAYSGWLQNNAIASLWIYSGLIAVLVPAFHYVLTALPGVPPGSDSMPLRCVAAGWSILLAAAAWLFPGLRRHAPALQFANVVVAIVVVAMLVVNSGNHYAYIASGLLVIVGAQQAFHRSWELALAFALGFTAQAIYSGLHGLAWTPTNIAALATFGTGYLVAFVPAALRIRVQHSELRGRLETQRVKEELLGIQAITHLGSWSEGLVTGSVEWSPQLFQMFEIAPQTPAAELNGLYERMVHPDDRAGFEHSLREGRRTGRPVALDHRVVAQSGIERWVELHGKFEYDASGAAVHWVGAVLDVSERKFTEEALARLAHFDPLTGLPNRTTALDLLGAAVERAALWGTPCAVAFLDLDRFKDINDTLGHAVGDVVLRDAAQRISQELGSDGLLARWGGDEFIAVIPGLRDGAVEELARRFISAMAKPLALDDVDFTIPVSVGIAMYPRDGDDPGVLIRNADTAMYKAKHDVGFGYAFFSESLHAAVAERHYVKNELSRALKENRFELHYQPIVDALSGRVVAAEALVRWIEPNGRVRLPGEFIAIAEDTRLIVPLGAWILNTACEQSAAWQRSGADVRVAVNVSPRQLVHAGFVATLASALASSGARAENLEIEITEAAIMSNAEPVLETLQAVHRMGIRVAIDDFGTGYSSFAYLKRFEVDSLKIDRTFVEGIEQDDNLAIARSIVSVADALGLPVTAEGVETLEQRHLMAGLGCARLQGFLFGRPVRAVEFGTQLVAVTM